MKNDAVHHNQWISVKKALPEREKYVLVLCEGGRRPQLAFRGPCIHAEYWYVEGELRKYYESGQVLFWAPITMPKTLPAEFTGKKWVSEKSIR